MPGSLPIPPYLATSLPATVIDCTRGVWQDCGVIPGNIAAVVIGAQGVCYWGSTHSSNYESAPEGTYNAAVVGTVDPLTYYNPAQCSTSNSVSASADFPAPWALVRPYSLALCLLRHDASAPTAAPANGGASWSTGVFQGDRRVALTRDQVEALAGGVSGPWRLWAVFSDDVYTDNANIAFVDSYGANVSGMEVGLSFVDPPAAPAMTATGQLIGNAPRILLAGG